MPEFFTGVVRTFDDRAGYGYIAVDQNQSLDSTRRLLVHRYSLKDRSACLRRGDAVRFRTEVVQTGELATDVELLSSEADENPEEAISLATLTGEQLRDFKSLALIARDSRRYDEAVRLYENGMARQPSIPLILSYAAMEKNRNRRREAMRIYMRGIEKFPRSAKLYEDAGVLALSMGETSEAITLYEKALTYAQKARQGAKGVLLKLAEAHYAIATVPSLSRALHYFRKASELGRNPLSRDAILQMNIAAVRTQHSRGNVSIPFLESCGFRVSRAELNPSATEGADLCVLKSTHTELVESYGLAGSMLVRCFFKSTITHADVVSLDQQIDEWSQSDLIDEQVALIIVGSLSEDLQRILSARIEQKNRPQPAIVPITQSEMETSKSPIDTLRTILDRWLFRRDLFATNSPVSGSRFFGRDKPLAEIRDAIATSTCAGVYGLRKVGKTSLLHESRRRATDLGHLVIYVDLLKLPADITNCDWLYWRIANALREESRRLAMEFRQVSDFKWRLGGVFPDFLDLPADFKIATAFDSDLSRFIDVLRGVPISPSPKIVLLLDEVERLLPTPLGKSEFSGFFDFLSYMRGLNQERLEFVLIVTGANAAISEIAQFDGKDNPVFNYLKEIYLPHLEPQECSRMLRVLGKGMGLRFVSGAEEQVFGLTGGHPFFARQLCSYIASTNSERPLTITGEIVKEVIESYLDSRSSDFAEIIERLRRDYPEELKVCEALARANGSLSRKAIGHMQGGETIKHLNGYQIVRVLNGNVTLSMELMTRWLQKRGGQ